MTYPYSVIERYPDGSKVTHYFETAKAAQAAIDELGAPHEGRTYELIER